MLRTSLAGFAFFCQSALRGVVAFAVDRRHFGPHRAQVHGKLSAMVDGVADGKLQKRDGRKLEHAAEVDHPGQLLTGEALKLLQVGGKTFIEPGDDAGRVLDQLRTVHWVEIERASRYSAQKAFFRSHNVPGKLQGSLADGV